MPLECLLFCNKLNYFLWFPGISLDFGHNSLSPTKFIKETTNVSHAYAFYSVLF